MGTLKGLDPTAAASTQDYWYGTLVAGLLALAVLSLLTWRLRRARVRLDAWTVAGGSAIFWAALSTALLWTLWDTYYRHFYPEWARWLAPLNAPVYGAIGYALWWLAHRLPGNVVVNFCLLGGLESLPEHLWGIYRLGILDKVPMLEGVQPVSVMAFAVPEYVIYWGLALGLAAFLQRGRKRWNDRWKKAKAI